MVRPISGNSKSNLTEITYRVEQSSICVDVSMNMSVLLNIFFGSNRSSISGNLCLSVRMTQKAVSKHSEGTQRIHKEHSESKLRKREQSDFFILLEPGILCLVYF